MADHNIEGHLQVLLRTMTAEPWQEIWEELQCSVATFAILGLSPDVADSDLWHACQASGVVLVTANRNKRGADSLEETIEEYNVASSLPVFTIADAESVLTDRDYAANAAIRLLEYLLDLDNYCGTGRLYVP